jgi:hypothetical protein
MIYVIKNPVDRTCAEYAVLEAMYVDCLFTVGVRPTRLLFYGTG